MANSPRYTGYISPPYSAKFTYDNGNPVDISAVNPGQIILLMQNVSTPTTYVPGVGSWSIIDGVNGRASYQWAINDLATPGTYNLYISFPKPGELGFREFDPDTIVVLSLPGGGLQVTTQDVNILQVSGAAVSSNNPVPISGPVTGSLPTGANVIGGVTISGTIPAGANNIGGVELIDSAGTNKAAIDSTGGQRVSLYGKSTNPGDTPYLLDSSGRPMMNIAQVGGTALALGQAIMSGSLPVVIASNQSNLPATIQSIASALSNANPLPVLNTAQTGYVAAFGSNAAATTSATDYLFKWGAGGTTQVNHIMIENNTGADIQWDLDTATTLGSPVLRTTQTVFLDIQTTVLHLQSAAAQNVNGSSANNIVVRAWL